MTISINCLNELLALDSNKPEFLHQATAILINTASDTSGESHWDVSKLTALLIKLISLIDSKLSEQMSLILQHSDFQDLEARWSSINNLISVPFNKNRVKIKCLDYDWNVVSADVNLSPGLKYSQLYNKIGNNELNTLGGEPFGMMLVDHQVSAELNDYSEYDDLYTLELLGALGQHCLCPFILSPQDNFFGESDAKWLSDTNRVNKVINGPDYVSWQKLRQVDSSRFLGLTLPKMKIREPYNNHSCGFVFNEVMPQKQDHYGLWGNAHFAFAATAIREFNRISWFGFLKSRWNDRLQGAVVNIPALATEHCWQAPEAKVRFFGHLAQFYAEQGFIPLSHSPLTDKYYFMDNHSVWKGPGTNDDKVLSLIQTTLICCRVAHYLKVQIRELLGSFVSAVECEQYLSKWLSKYVSNVSSGNDETMAKYPLRSAQVKVREAEATPGEYVCEVSLQPQYQFDMFAGQIMLTTDLAESA